MFTAIKNYMNKCFWISRKSNVKTEAIVVMVGNQLTAVPVTALPHAFGLYFVVRQLKQIEADLAIQLPPFAKLGDIFNIELETGLAATFQRLEREARSKWAS